MKSSYQAKLDKIHKKIEVGSKLEDNNEDDESSESQEILTNDINAYHSIKGMMNLIDVIITKYKFIHPTNCN